MMSKAVEFFFSKNICVFVCFVTDLLVVCDLMLKKIRVSNFLDQKKSMMISIYLINQTNTQRL